ncbi:transcriptional regulator [Leptospira wolffii]|uniref:FecR domain-containing protein n=1 Tax=Leptospira wolffii TaxID=409998 RepID=UPI001082AC42|nr:FecR domain-containing protein [Leptospira wolffii]TGK56981.1 transcriptional regulator [Leptospira wolffii]TGK71014.1 transcriptional regulator [Leptospira wolffii]TGK75705.1 transcriptional regulator [Leptospira wolffii]TGL32753.1 transcriptional regulator [Leptospira wolffii]
MRYLTDGRYVVTALLLLLFLFSGLLYLYANAGPKTGTNKIVGELKSKQFKILRKLDSEVVWEELDESDPIRYKDTIRTEEDSEAVLLFTDGENSAEIRLDERSMILVEDTDKISFMSGSLSATSSGGGAKLQISAGDTKISLGNSDVKLSSDDNKGLNLEVKKGEAKVASASGESVVSNNQSAEVQGGKVEVHSLNLETISPADKSNIPVKTETVNLDLSWKPAPGVKSYRVELAKDSGFRTGLKKWNTNATNTSVSLTGGSYYWRVVGKNPQSGKEESSSSKNFRLISWSKPRLLSPTSKEVFSYSANLSPIRFQWSTNDPGSKYKLEVSEDGGFKQILYTADSNVGFAKWDPKPEGQFFARVRMFSEREGFTELVSDSVPFSVRKLSQAEPPQLLRPLAGEEIGIRIFKNGSFFSWSSNKEFKSYILEIASDPDFKSVIYSKNTTANFIKPEYDWKENTYYWRVRANLASQGEISSAVNRFVLRPLLPMRLAFPKDGSELGHPNDGKLSFRWDRPDPTGTYKLEVSRDANFGSKVTDTNIRSGVGSVDLPGPGDYYWRVSLLSPEGDTVIVSPVAAFKTLDSAPFVTPSYPRDGDKVDLDEKESLAFYWESEGKADSYILELLESNKKAWKTVFKKEIRGESFDFRELYRLKEGKYQWRLSAKYRDSSGTARTTLPLSRDFEVVISATLKAPEVLTPKEFYVE